VVLSGWFNESDYRRDTRMVEFGNLDVDMWQLEISKADLLLRMTCNLHNCVSLDWATKCVLSNVDVECATVRLHA
jgi:hypothetical protein